MRHEADCHVDPLEADATPRDLETAIRIDLAVAGMGCPNCAARVRNGLLRGEGVLEAEVSHRTSLARVWYEADRTDPDGLCRAVARASEGTHHDYRAVPIASRLH